MNNEKFAHLHVHSEHSYLDGFGSAEKYVGRAKKLGQKYIALTDHGSIDGLIRWQKECDKQKIHPILGCEAYIVPDRHIKEKGEKRGHITILVKDQSGWKSLCSLLTEANLTGFYYRPRIDYSLLLSHDLSGLIILTACAGSFLLLSGAEEFFARLISKAEVYFEIMPHKIDSQKVVHDCIKILSRKFNNVSFVATNDCHYIEKGEWEAQEMLLAINSRAKWGDPKRWTFGFKGLHLRSAKEMVEEFASQNHWSGEIVSEAIENTVKIAEKCRNFRIKKQDISLPLVSGIALEDEFETLTKICEQGYKKRYGNETFKKEHRKRYEQELSLINKKGFIRYFLIVHNLINWAKENGIMIGPGRGSVGGSFIAYLMGITQIDPMQFDLSFHRFISEDRLDLPDIDIDVEKRYRDKVVKYIKDTYGQNNTCGISTCMTMQSKSAIRDVGRVMEIPSKEINQLAGNVWKSVKDLNEFFEKSTEGKTFKKKYPKETNLMTKMEGQIRGSGRHAAAVVISKDDLTKTDKCVLVNRTKQMVCNWTMGDSEYVGLMKLDILGLSTLSVLTEAKELINRKENTRKFYYNPETGHKIVLAEMERELDDRYQDYNEIEFDFNAIPLEEDEKVFNMISEGRTSGLFQLSGYSVTEFCKKMKIHSFNDIIAAISLARPGPFDSGMADEYVDRKHGKKWKGKHPIYEEVTKGTYGICVYQEQIMAVISKVAGLDESTADKIRKIIAKKLDTKKLKPFWEMFKGGCKKMKTFSEQEAEDFWDELKRHASYSFNKSHAGAYAMIGYWTAWLKVHYQREFYAASLTFNEWNEKSGDSNKRKESLLKEIRMAGYEIEPPKRNKSDAAKWQFNDKKFYTPFIEINGIGENNASKCLIAPKKGRIQGFFSSQISCNVQNDTKLDKILQEMMVDDVEIPSQKILSKYLPNINLRRNKNERYPNLMNFLGFDFPDSELDNWLTLNVSSKNIPLSFLQRKRFRLEKPIYQCNRCELRQRSGKPILSSTGLNNVVILFEHPEIDNPRQDKIGTNEKGKLIFDELAKHEYKRRFFQTTACCRCPISSSKCPTIEIDKCHHWLSQEAKHIECRLILGIGNRSVYSLTGRNDNIEDLAGTTEWIENLSAWACWCDEKNLTKSIENFVQILKKVV